MANELKLDLICQRVFQMSSRRYRQLVMEQGFPPVINGYVDVVAAAAAVCKYYKNLLSGHGSITLTDERARLTKINADRKQLLLEKERGELINTERAMFAWGLIAKNIDNKLSSLPRKSAPLLFGLQIPEIEARQKKLIDEVRDEISNPNLRELTGMGRGKNGGAVTPEKTAVKRKAVGRQKQGFISGE